MARDHANYQRTLETANRRLHRSHIENAIL